MLHDFFNLSDESHKDFSSVIMSSYVALRDILESNRDVLFKTTDKKQNCLGSNFVEDISINCPGLT